MNSFNIQELSHHPNVFLLGGYFRNPNYGDVIQALVWYSYYLRKNYHVSIIFDEAFADINDFKHFFPLADLVDVSHILNKTHQIDSDSIIHLYGGGYLNEAWGDIFLNVLELYYRSNLIIMTGIQVDKYFEKKYRKSIGSQKNIKLISVRDPSSRNYVNKYSPDAIVCDDSFIYFSKFRKNTKYRSEKRNVQPRILVHLNAGRRVTSQLFPSRSLRSLFYSERQETQDNLLFLKKIAQLLFTLQKKGYAIDLMDNFYQTLEDEPEASLLFDQLKCISELSPVNIVSTFELESHAPNYRMGISTSFHAAVLMSLYLEMPLCYIALNPYYRQKAESLLHSELLPRETMICRTADIGTIPHFLEQPLQVSDHSSIKTSVKRVLDTVDSILSDHRKR